MNHLGALSGIECLRRSRRTSATGAEWPIRISGADDDELTRILDPILNRGICIPALGAPTPKSRNNRSCLMDGAASYEPMKHDSCNKGCAVRFGSN
jgi:hypothetical protein